MGTNNKSLNKQQALKQTWQPKWEHHCLISNEFHDVKLTFFLNRSIFTACLKTFDIMVTTFTLTTDQYNKNLSHEKEN